MTERRHVLERIAAALERMAPQTPPPIDWQRYPAYLWTNGAPYPVEPLDALPLERLRGIESQKRQFCDNIQRLSAGAAAHDMLLWGARGMGKSALIRAAVAETQRNGADLALVQLNAPDIADAPRLIGELSKQHRPVVLFIDDLGFGETDIQANLALRSLLDGGVLGRPLHVRVAVTTNRRAIVQRESGSPADLHERDERDNALALADRFGLTLAFHPCDQATYLEILRSYTDPLGLEIVEEEALAWAIARGNRSGRTAFQFASELAGRAGLSL